MVDVRRRPGVAGDRDPALGSVDDRDGAPHRVPPAGRRVLPGARRVADRPRAADLRDHPAAGARIARTPGVRRRPGPRAGSAGGAVPQPGRVASLVACRAVHRGRCCHHPSVGVGARQLRGMGRRPRERRHLCGRAVRPARPHPRRCVDATESPGLRPVRSARAVRSRRRLGPDPDRRRRTVPRGRPGRQPDPVARPPRSRCARARARWGRGDRRRRDRGPTTCAPRSRCSETTSSVATMPATSAPGGSPAA